MPLPALNSAFDGLYGPGDQWYWRADFVNEIPDEAIVRGVEHLSGVPGRFESVDEGQPFAVLVDYAHTEPGQVEPTLRHHAGVLSGLPAKEGAAHPTAALGDPLDDGRHLLRDDTSHRQVVQEEQRLRPRAHDVVGAHGHQVDAHGRESPRHSGHLQLRPHAVGGGGQVPPRPDPE